MARRGKQPTHPFTKAARGIRLQKALAAAGIDSRRRCEELIEQGLVQVNGHFIDALPAWVDPEKDSILVEGKPLRKQQRGVYVMLFKPKGVLSTVRDPEGRPGVLDMVEHYSKARLFPVGRLDIDASGLILLTNDGELANRLTHPRYEMTKGYELTVKGEVGADSIRRIEQKLFVTAESRGTARGTTSSLEIITRDRDRTILYMELRESRNREIRPVMLALGHPVTKMRRVRIGPLELKSLAVGEWRDLTTEELGRLRKEAFADAATIFRRRSAAEQKAKSRNEASPPSAVASAAPRAAPKSDESRSRRPYRKTRTRLK
ncbi:MAG: rRNA pseudouridine synthase [Phycisphaerales bacterium]|nr:rRNA pseudouridine synthase [Phycisphaerales bacterium]